MDLITILFLSSWQRDCLIDSPYTSKVFWNGTAEPDTDNYICRLDLQSIRSSLALENGFVVVIQNKLIWVYRKLGLGHILLIHGGLSQVPPLNVQLEFLCWVN